MIIRNINAPPSPFQGVAPGWLLCLDHICNGNFLGSPFFSWVWGQRLSLRLLWLWCWLSSWLLSCNYLPLQLKSHFFIATQPLQNLITHIGFLFHSKQTFPANSYSGLLSCSSVRHCCSPCWGGHSSQYCLISWYFIIWLVWLALAVACSTAICCRVVIKTLWLFPDFIILGDSYTRAAHIWQPNWCQDEKFNQHKLLLENMPNDRLNSFHWTSANLVLWPKKIFSDGLIWGNCTWYHGCSQWAVPQTHFPVSFSVGCKHGSTSCTISKHHSISHVGDMPSSPGCCIKYRGFVSRWPMIHSVTFALVF